MAKIRSACLPATHDSRGFCCEPGCDLNLTRRRRPADRDETRARSVTARGLHCPAPGPGRAPWIRSIMHRTGSCVCQAQHCHSARQTSAFRRRRKSAPNLPLHRLVPVRRIIIERLATTPDGLQHFFASIRCFNSVCLHFGYVIMFRVHLIKC